MKISDIAASLNVSKQAVYQRLKSKGISVNQLTDAKTGEITAEGAEIIRQLYVNKESTSVDHVSQQSINQSTKLTEAPTEVERLTNEVNRLTSEVNQLTNQIELLQTKLAGVETDRDHLHEQLQIQNQMLNKSIDNLMVKLIPETVAAVAEDQQGNDAAPTKRGLLARLFSKR